MELVVVGKLVNTHGLKGEVKIKSDFERKDLIFKKGKKLIIDNTEFVIKNYKVYKDTDLLQKRVRQMINGLATCGLNASLISNSDLRLVLENFLNGGTSTEFGTVMPV